MVVPNFFLSHMQDQTGKEAMAVYVTLQKLGIATSWLDPQHACGETDQVMETVPRGELLKVALHGLQSIQISLLRYDNLEVTLVRRARRNGLRQS